MPEAAAPRRTMRTAGSVEDGFLMGFPVEMDSRRITSFERLLQLARDDDAAALGEVLERQRHPLTILAQIQLGSRLKARVDPSDLVQETFLQAQRAFPHFLGTTEPQFAHWCRQILVKTLGHLIRYHRRQSRNVRLEQPLSAALAQSQGLLDQALVAHQRSPSSQADREEQIAQLADALGHLPERYREVLQLYYLQHLSFSEVAKHMGRTVDSVEKLRKRALDRLRCLMRGGY